MLHYEFYSGRIAALIRYIVMNVARRKIIQKEQKNTIKKLTSRVENLILQL